MRFLSIFLILILMGCYTNANIIGKYTIFEAQHQYEILFDMKWDECKDFLTFNDGWWKADLKKLKEKGINIKNLCERYCRIIEIKIPFPVIINYNLVRENNEMDR